jgi:hypothetical protein
MCKIVDTNSFIYDQLVGKKTITILALFQAINEMQQNDPNVIVDLNRDTILDFVIHEPGVIFVNNEIIKKSDYFDY